MGGEITISNKPSREPNDSGVTVTYPAPKSGEEEKGITALFCTAVKFELKIVAIPNYHELPNGKTIFIVSTPVSGIALPKSSFKIPIATKIE
ncbi:MAG TPA: hypothetical protein PLJ44_10270, partial [Victivallales bacterium]|nr:hypothetical protein [Victivallales bacterium]